MRISGAGPASSSGEISVVNVDTSSDVDSRAAISRPVRSNTRTGSGYICDRCSVKLNVAAGDREGAPVAELVGDGDGGAGSMLAGIDGGGEGVEPILEGLGVRRLEEHPASSSPKLISRGAPRRMD